MRCFDGALIGVHLLQIDTATTTSDKMGQNFISQHEFQASSSRVEKDLLLKAIYRIDEFKEKTVDRNGGKVSCNYAVVTNREGVVTNVWLTSVIEEVYMQSLGLKKSKENGRSFYDFEIVRG